MNPYDLHPFSFLNVPFVLANVKVPYCNGRMEKVL